jgi:hypothetical protein
MQNTWQTYALKFICYTKITYIVRLVLNTYSNIQVRDKLFRKWEIFKWMVSIFLVCSKSSSYARKAKNVVFSTRPINWCVYQFIGQSLCFEGNPIFYIGEWIDWSLLYNVENRFSYLVMLIFYLGQLIGHLGESILRCVFLLLLWNMFLTVRINWPFFSDMGHRLVRVRNLFFFPCFKCILSYSLLFSLHQSIGHSIFSHILHTYHKHYIYFTRVPESISFSYPKISF